MKKSPTITVISDRLLYTVQALQGEIRPNMRQISIDYNEKTNTFTVYLYMDIPLSQEELAYDITGTIIDKIKSHFSEEIHWQGEIIVLPYPKPIPHQGNCVYCRHEEPFD